MLKIFSFKIPTWKLESLKLDTQTLISEFSTLKFDLPTLKLDLPTLKFIFTTLMLDFLELESLKYIVVHNLGISNFNLLMIHVLQ